MSQTRYSANFRFFGGLNDFLPRRQRHQTIQHHFDWRASIKDMIESLGLPHPEIDVLLVNGVSVDFDAIVRDGDQIAVYPYDETPGAEKIRHLIPANTDKPRFILDTHLGRLAAYLRMMGFDTLYRNDYPDDELAQVSHDEGRILLTRDIGLLKRSLVERGYFMRQTEPAARLQEITRRYALKPYIEPFKYCMRCNGLLQAVEKSAILDRISTRTAANFDAFHRCERCEQIYWQGGHYERLQELIARIREET